MGIIESVESLAGKYGMFPSSGTVVAAVSGGADSMCLLDVLTRLSGKYGFTVAAAHFNHCLRGSESDGDESFVREYCDSAGIYCVTGRGDVNAEAKRSGLGTEEAARKLRYAFLSGVCAETGASRAATAHTANDNAETVLLNLTRGAGLRGLCGIPPVRGIYIRPFLCVTREEIDDYLSERSIPHREDSTNSSDAYSRNRIRHNVIPVLCGINPALFSNVASASASLREDEEYLESLADVFLSGASPGHVSAGQISALPHPVAARVIRRLGGRGLSYGHVEKVLRLCCGASSGRVDLPGITVRREYDDVEFLKDPSEKTFSPFSLSAGETVENYKLGLRFSCEKCDFPGNINKSFTNYLLNYDEIGDNVVIRPRISGDKIKLSPSSGTKTLKKLFIENRIPASERALVPVIADSCGPVAVYGLGVDARAWSRPGSAVLKIKIEEII